MILLLPMEILFLMFKLLRSSGVRVGRLHGIAVCVTFLLTIFYRLSGMGRSNISSTRKT